MQQVTLNETLFSNFASQSDELKMADLPNIEPVNNNIVSSFTQSILSKVDQINGLYDDIKSAPSANLTMKDYLRKQVSSEEFVTEVSLASKEVGLISKSLDTLVTKIQ